MIHFIKMHGLGNDFVFIDCMDGKDIGDENALAVKLCHRHTGVGGDGLIVLRRCADADAAMRIINSDGTEAQGCGNATRCAARYLYERGYVSVPQVALRTLRGLLSIDLLLENGMVVKTTANMGAAILDPELIPVRAQGTPPRLTLDGREYTCVSMGNPHAVTFVEDVDGFDVEGVGRAVESDGHFPEKVNVEFAQVVDKHSIKMRVWERGAGATLACGTGACATVVVAVLNGLAERQATVTMPGGKIRINYADDAVYMAGPTSLAFEGEWIDD